MYCPYCLKFINAPNPEVCPHCGSILKKKKFNWGSGLSVKLSPKITRLAIGLLVFLVLVSLVDFGGDESDSGHIVETIAASDDTGSNGDMVGENFTLSIVCPIVSESVTLDSGMNMDVEFFPAEGKQFLIVLIDATNTSDEIRNLGTFLSYVDGTSILPTNILGKYEDRLIFTGAVHPGKTMETYIMYEIPMEYDVFEMSYVDSMTGSVSNTAKIYGSDADH